MEPDAIVVGSNDAVAIVIHTAIHQRGRFAEVRHQQRVVGDIHDAIIVEVAQERIEGDQNGMVVGCRELIGGEVGALRGGAFQIAAESFQRGRLVGIRSFGRWEW